MNFQHLCDVITDAINRLRRCHSASQAAEYQVGFTAGHEWATLWRDPVELERIAQLARSGGIKVPEDGDAGEWLATQIGEVMGFNPSHRDFLCRVRSVLFPDPDAVYSPAFVTGYLEGAAEVWQALQTNGLPGGGDQN